MLRAEIEHFLSLGNAADERPGDARGSKMRFMPVNRASASSAPTSVIVPSSLSTGIKGSMSCLTGTVLRMKSKRVGAAFIASGIGRDDDFIGAERRASSRLSGVVENTDVRAERVRELDPHVSESAQPDDADLVPGPTSSGAAANQSVMPAHSKGAPRATSMPAGTLSTKWSRTTIWSE